MVMEKLRKQTKLYLWIVVGAFIGWIFFQLGENIASRRKLKPWQRGILAEVDGKQITYEMFRYKLQQAIQDSINALGHSITPEERSKIEESVFKNLITDTKLYDFYRNRKLLLDDKTALALIQNFPPRELLDSPDFQDENGKFDMNKYRQALSNPQNLPFFRNYELKLRNELPKFMMQADLLATLNFSPDELWNLYKRDKTRIKIKYLAINYASIPDSVINYTDEDLKKYYEENPDLFKRPPKASLELVFLEKVPSSEDTAEARLNAESILDELKLSDVEVNFDDLVRDYSEDLETKDNKGDLGWIDSTNTLLRPLYDAAMKLKKGDVGGPVLTNMGWHVFKVVDKKKGKVHLKHILLKISTGPTTEAELREKADDLIDLAKKEGFKKAAEELGLEVKETGEFPLTSGFIPFVGPEKVLQDFVKEGQPGDISPIVRKPDKYIVAAIKSKKPEEVPPFEEVKKEVTSKYLKAKKEEIAKATMQKVYEDVKNGLEFEKIAEKYKDEYVKVDSTKYITRKMFIPSVGFNNEFFGAAFSLEKGEISRPVATNRGIYVIKVLDKQLPTKEQFEKERDQFVNSIRNTYTNYLYTAWTQELEKGNIKDYRSYLLY